LQNLKIYFIFATVKESDCLLKRSIHTALRSQHMSSTNGHEYEGWIY